MNAENFSFYNCSYAQIVEDLRAIFPRVGISILSNSFIIESIDSCNLPGFVVSSE